MRSKKEYWSCSLANCRLLQIVLIILKYSPLRSSQNCSRRDGRTYYGSQCSSRFVDGKSRHIVRRTIRHVQEAVGKIEA